MKLRKTLAGILGAVVMLLGVGTFEHVNRDTGVHAADGDNYVKVTGTQSDWSGDYLIVYETGNVCFDGSLTNLDQAKMAKTVTIQDGKIISDSDIDKCKFTITKSGSNYTVKSASGKYIGQSSNANGLKFDKEYSNSISFNASDSSVNIVSGGAYLRYNAASDQLRFRYYKSSSYTNQKAIHLYKLTTAGGEEPEQHICEFVKPSENIAPVTAADCVNPAVFAYVCNVEGCGKTDITQTYTVGEALGHDYKDGSCSRCKEIDAKYHVNQLFNKYYNKGSYVKETVLNTNEFVDEDVKNYFHDGAQVKYRKTTYTLGELSMVTKATSEAEWGTHTSTYRDNGTGVDHLTNGVKDYSVSGTVNGQDRSSVENWYVTLHDFVNTELTGWEYADGVYTLSLKDNELATKMAREFVAPMWLDTEEAKNYAQFDKLTVEEVSESLVMKLYVDSTNSGQLVDGANLVFSQATIERTIDTSAKDVTESLNLSFTDLANKSSGDIYMNNNYPAWIIENELGNGYGGYLGFGREGDNQSSITSPLFNATGEFNLTAVLKGNGNQKVATSTITFEVLDKDGNVIATGGTVTPPDAVDTTYDIAFTYNPGKSYLDASYIRLSFNKETGNIGLKSLSASYVD